jgi:hypothetical protein
MKICDKGACNMKKRAFSLIILLLSSIMLQTIVNANDISVNKFKLKYDIEIEDFSSGIVKVKLNISNINESSIKVREETKDGYFNNVKNLTIHNSEGEQVDFSLFREINHENSNTKGKEWIIDTVGSKEIVLEYISFKQEQINGNYNGYVGDEFAVFSGDQILITPSDFEKIDDNIEVNFRVPQGSSIVTPWVQEGTIYYPNKQYIEFEKNNSQVNPVTNLLRSNIAIGNFTLYSKMIDKANVSIAVPGTYSNEKQKILSENIFNMFDYFARLFGGSLDKDYLYIYMPPSHDLLGINVNGGSLGQGIDLIDGYYSLTHSAHGFFHRWNGWLYGFHAKDMGQLFNEGINRYYEGKSIIYSLEKLKGISYEEANYLKSLYIEYKNHYSKNIDRVYAQTDFTSPPNSIDNNTIIYNKGALICLALDMKIKEDTNHTKSLDDILKIIGGKFSLYRDTLTPSILLSILKDETGKDYSQFLNDYVFDKKLLDLDKYFVDKDNDGIETYVELIRGTNPNSFDTFDTSFLKYYKLYDTVDENGNIPNLKMKNTYKYVDPSTVWFFTQNTNSTLPQVEKFTKENLPEIQLTTKEGKTLKVKSAHNGYVISGGTYYSPVIELKLDERIVPGVEYKVTFEPAEKWIVFDNILFDRNLNKQNVKLVNIKLANDNDEIKITQGENREINVIGIYEDGTEIDVTEAVKFTSNNKDIANVNDEGILNGIKNGHTQIIAELNGLKVNINCSVEKKIELQTIRFNTKSINILKGTKLKLKAEGVFSDRSIRNILDGVIWSSSNKSVATVNSQGIVTGIKEGKSVIKAEKDGVKAELIVSVKPKNTIKKLLIPTNTLKIKKGKTTQVKVYALYLDGTKKDITKITQWSSNNKNISIN